MPFVHVTDSDLTVRDIWSDGQWNFQNLYTILDLELRNLISQVYFDESNAHADGWVWNGVASGVYTAISGYKWLLENGVGLPSDTGWSWIWQVQAPEKIRLFLWLVL